MSSPHRINLQAAWDADGAAWTRSFGRPSGVGSGDRIWLVLESAGGCAATLNGRSLGDAGPAVRHDVTGDLRQRNSLRLEFTAAPGSPAVHGRSPLPVTLATVALEIESHG